MIFVLGALASYRLTRLVVEDSILDRPRDWLTQKATWIEALLGCYFCAGFWVSVLVTLLLYAGGVSLPFVGWLLLPLAFSATTGILGTFV